MRLGVAAGGGVKTGKYHQKTPPLRSSPYEGDKHRGAGFIRNNTISKVSGFDKSIICTNSHGGVNYKKNKEPLRFTRSIKIG